MALSNVASKVLGGHCLRESSRVGLQRKLYEHIGKTGKSQGACSHGADYISFLAPVE